MIHYKQFCGVPGRDHEEAEAVSNWDIASQGLISRLNAANPPFLLDVREPHELEISALPNAKNIPLGTLAARLSELDTAQEMVVFCKSGGRSLRGLELLTSARVQKGKKHKGGIQGWGQE